MEDNRLDIVIFGATGFTGKHTVKEIAKLTQQKEFTFGIAGRRKEALDNVLKEVAPNSENVPVIIADLKDDKSLEEMTRQARVIINCCGPYRFYGEQVVKACIATRTHHVDVSGEPQYMESMQLKYNDAAREAGVYIISACGFDSIPCDLGIIFTQQNFEGEINDVETYLNIWKTNNIKSAALHYGTWESAVYGLAHADELRPLRMKLFAKKLPEFKPKLKQRGLIHRNTISQGWSTEFPGSDRTVVRRTQRFLYDEYNQRPIQIHTYITFKSLFQVLSVAVVGAVFSILARFECGRNLLLKYPAFFSAGMATHEGPKPEAMENTYFSITIVARGWSEKQKEIADKPFNKKLTTMVTGCNPGYGATCTMLALSAITILKESEKMPHSGGVLPPGAAFGKTSLITELIKNGMKFEIISSE